MAANGVYYIYTAASKARSTFHEVIYDSPHLVDFQSDFLFLAMCHIPFSAEMIWQARSQTYRLRGWAADQERHLPQWPHKALWSSDTAEWLKNVIDGAAAMLTIHPYTWDRLKSFEERDCTSHRLPYLGARFEGKSGCTSTWHNATSMAASLTCDLHREVPCFKKTFRSRITGWISKWLAFHTAGLDSEMLHHQHVVFEDRPTGPGEKVWGSIRSGANV